MTNTDIDDYLAGRLRDAALDEFEIRLLESPALLSQVQEQIAAQEAMPMAPSAASVATPNHEHNSLLSRFRERFINWHSAAVAGTTAAACALAMTILTPPTATPMAGPSVVASIQVGVSRGTAQTVNIGQLPTHVQIDAGPGVNVATVSVHQFGKVVLAPTEHSADDGLISVFFPAPTGTYDVTVQPAGSMRTMSFSLIAQ